MSIIIDIAIVLLIGFNIFFGYKKGLVGVAFKILSFFVALIVVAVLTNPIANLIMNTTDVGTNLQTTIERRFIEDEPSLEHMDENVQIEGKNEFSKEVLKYIEDSSADIKEAGIKAIAKGLATTVIKALVAIGLFIITKIVLFFFRHVAEKIAELPLIKQFNKAGGIIYGVIMGLIMVYVIFAIASLVAPAMNNTEFFVAINNSFIGSVMYNNNLLLKMLF